MPSPWLERTGLMWLHATEGENDFAEKVSSDGVAVYEPVSTLATQARLGYCWSHLSQLYPHRTEFLRAAEKSFRCMQFAFAEPDVDFRIYDNSFFLLFMAWYYRVSKDPTAIRLLMNRYSDVERHFENAGVGGFVEYQAGLRSHNPYMHLLEAMLAAFRSTNDDYWLAQSARITDLFTTRFFDAKKKVVFELLNPDWSVAAEGRVEIGHQFEWSTLLRETGRNEFLPYADRLQRFALRHGFEHGLAIDAVDGDGEPMDRGKLLWVQTEAARSFSGTRADSQWKLIRQYFFHANGWTWHNRLNADNTSVEEPSNARLLYHVVSAAADSLT